MSIAAGVVITVSAPRAELEKDLKAIGSSMGELRGIVKKAFAGDPTSDLQRQMKALRVAFQSGNVGPDAYRKSMKMLKDEMQGVPAQMENVRKKVAQIKKEFADPKASFKGDMKELGTLRSGGKISPEEFKAAAAARIKQYQDEAGITARINQNAKETADKEKTLLAVREKNKQIQRDILETATKIKQTQQAAAAAAAQAAKNGLNGQRSGIEANNAASLAGNLNKSRSPTQVYNAQIAQLREWRKEMGLTNTQVTQLATMYRKQYEDAAGVTKRLKDAEKALADQRARGTKLWANSAPIRAYKEQIREYFQLLRAGAITEQQHIVLMAQARAQYIATNTSLGQLRGTMNKALSAVGLNNPYVYLTLAIGGAIKEGMQFQKNLSAVRAVSDLTADSMDRLANSALQLGTTSQFSAAQVAEAQKFLAQAGMSANQILASQAAVLDLATAGEMDLANATEISVRVLGAMHMRADQLNEVVDALATGANKSVASVESLAEAMKFVGPLSSQAGLSLQETTAALMTLSQQGLHGELGGTGFRNFMLMLSNPTDEAHAAMMRLGVTVDTTKGGFQSLMDIIDQFHEKTKNMGGKEQLQFFGQIFKTRTAVTAMALSQDPEMFRKFLADQHGGVGAGQKQAAEMADNLAGDLRRLWNVVKSVATEMEEGLDSGLRDVVESFNMLAQVLGLATNFIAMLSGGMKAFYYMLWQGFAKVFRAISTYMLPKFLGGGPQGIVTQYFDALDKNVRDRRISNWDKAGTAAGRLGDNVSKLVDPEAFARNKKHEEETKKREELLEAYAKIQEKEKELKTLSADPSSRTDLTKAAQIAELMHDIKAEKAKMELNGEDASRFAPATTIAEQEADLRQKEAYNTYDKINDELETQVRWLGKSKDQMTDLQLLADGVSLYEIRQLEVKRRLVSQQEQLTNWAKKLADLQGANRYFGQPDINRETGLAKEEALKNLREAQLMLLTNQGDALQRIAVAQQAILQGEKIRLETIEAQNQATQLKGLDDLSSQSAEADAALKIYKDQHREMDALDKLMNDMRAAGADPTMLGTMEGYVNSIRAANTALKDFQKQDDERKKMDEEAKEVALTDPKAKFQAEYAKLEALRRSTLAADPKADMTGFDLRQKELEKQFSEASAANFASKAPAAIEKGSQEEFKLLNDVANPQLQVSKQILQQTIKSVATQDKIKDALGKAGKDDKGRDLKR